MARALGGLWLAIYLLIGTAAPVLDARADHSDRVVAHWEDAGESNCPISHADSACRICQLLTGGRALPTVTEALRDVTGSAGVAIGEPDAEAPRLVLRGGLTSRAPPLG